jgi:hypothetical protein
MATAPHFEQSEDHFVDSEEKREQQPANNLFLLHDLFIFSHS